jgi:hypothetical protein
MTANKEYLAGKHHAQLIASGCDVAFFVSSHNAIAAEWHWKGVHEHFAKLAEDLGYRIEKIAPEQFAKPEICSESLNITEAA